MAQIKGGDRLEKYLRDLARKVSRPGVLRVGFLEGSTDENGTSNAMKAAILNYGAPKVGIPPRPFFSTMVALKSRTWGEVVEKALEAANFDAPNALMMVGEHIVGELRQAIDDTTSPPLKPATIRRKGFDKPLVHTNSMRGSAAYEVKE